MRRDGGAYPYALKPDGSIVGASSFYLHLRVTCAVLRF